MRGVQGRMVRTHCLSTVFAQSLHTVVHICVLLQTLSTSFYIVWYSVNLNQFLYLTSPLFLLSSLPSSPDHFPPRSSSVPPLSIHTTTNHDRPLSSDPMMIVHFIDNGRYVTAVAALNTCTPHFNHMSTPYNRTVY